MTSVFHCLACRSHTIASRIDFGLQPLSNRLLTVQNEDEEKFQRCLVQCESCGLFQFEGLNPPDALRPRHEPSRFNEPEGHLDEMVAGIVSTNTLRDGDLIVGLSYKDTTTLERLEKAVPLRTVTVDLTRDFGENFPTAGLETIQALLDESRARTFVERHGKAKAVVARHFLEHVQNFTLFADAMRTLLEDDGMLVLEEPDFSTPLATSDCSTIWEERSAFFTPATLESTLHMLGFTLLRRDTHPYPLENAVTVVAKAGERADAGTLNLAGELARGAAYTSNVPLMNRAVRKHLSTVAEEGREVAIFGAGHMSCNFINLLGIGDLVAFAIDDHPKKCGRFLPGSRIPILPSEALNERNTGFCLLSVRPEIENAIISKFPTFSDRGGVFASILPVGPRSLRTMVSE